MARAFASTDIVQTNSGTASLQVDPSIALTSPATEGNGGIIVMAAQTVVAPPGQWHTAAAAGTADGSPQLAIMCRADLPPADQSWAFATFNGATANWCWLAEEWTNFSFAPFAGSARTNLQSAPSSISTGTTGAFTADYVAGIAAVLLFGGPTAAAWSTPSWSGSFVETDVLSVGTGTGSTDMQLRIARRYGTLSDAGAWSTTATWSGAQTGKTVYAAIAAFRAESFSDEA